MSEAAPARARGRWFESLSWKLALLFTGVTLGLLLLHGLTMTHLGRQRFLEMRAGELQTLVTVVGWELTEEPLGEGEEPAARFREVAARYPGPSLLLVAPGGRLLETVAGFEPLEAPPREVPEELWTREGPARWQEGDTLFLAERIQLGSWTLGLVAAAPTELRRGRGFLGRAPPLGIHRGRPRWDRGGPRSRRRAGIPAGLPGRPKGPPRGPWNFGSRLLVISGLVFVAALLAGLLGVRLLALRLGVLEEGVRRLTEGDLDVRLDPGPADEVGRVIRDFNAMAAKLQAARAEVAYQDQARRELLADVSHELRTPLTGLLCQLQLVQEQAEGLAEGERERVRAAVAEGQALGQRIEDLLTLARDDVDELPLELEPVNLQRLLAQLAERLRPVLAAGGVELGCEFSPERFEVQGDLQRLEQVFRNLIENARAVLVEGGTIQLRVCQGGPGEVVVEVTDDGPGVPEEEQASLFERFHRGSGARGGGTGLGLAIVRRLVERHQGRVELESPPGEGATFRVVLPTR